MDNTEEIVKSVKESMEKMEKNDFSMYFFVMDTKGAPVGSVANIYEHVKMLNELGYNAEILHEKNDYVKQQLEYIKMWLGEEYGDLPHSSIEDQSVKINPTDFIIIPELFANVMEQTSKMPGKRVVLCQAYDYITETLQPGKSWLDYGITDCITTTEQQKEYIQNLFNNNLLDVRVVPVGISGVFKKPTKPKKPIVAVYTRDQRETVKLFKTFYLKNPHLKWVTFRDMRGMTKEVFSKALAESCVSVWIDDIAGFGTYPLESMKCGTPVIGKIPNLMNGWINEKNGIWVDNNNIVPDLLSQFLQTWLEDNQPEELYSKMDETAEGYTLEIQKEKLKEVYESIIEKRKEEFNKTLAKYLEVDNVNQTNN
jgi:hypothetical protein